MFELRCRQVGFDCPGVVSGDTKEAVLQQAAAHAAQVHGVQASPALAAKVMAAIQQVQPQADAAGPAPAAPQDRGQPG